MNSDILKGNWNKAKGKIKDTWGKLTDDEITKIEGNYDSLIGTIQEKYGQAKEKVEESVNDFLKTFKNENKKDETTTKQ